MSDTMHKTEIVIWTSYDPAEVELADLAYQASEGDAYASKQTSTLVPAHSLAADPDATDGMLDFFEIETPKDTDSSHEATAGPNGGPHVMATLTKDGQVEGVEFDATAWFETAEIVQIRDLINCNFGGDYPADAVANHFRGINDEITALLDECDDEGEGFEVHVEPIDAIAWIAAHRPDDMLSMAIREWKNFS